MEQAGTMLMPHPDAYAAGWDACRDGAPLSPPCELDLDGAVAWGDGWFDYVLAMNSRLTKGRKQEYARTE